MRDPEVQKVIDYTLKKANPIIPKVGSEALDQLSTKTRTDIKYKTDRPDFDGKWY